MDGSSECYPKQRRKASGLMAAAFPQMGDEEGDGGSGMRPRMARRVTKWRQSVTKSCQVRRNRRGGPNNDVREFKQKAIH